jgi:hypothetical protein
VHGVFCVNGGFRILVGLLVGVPKLTNDLNKIMWVEEIGFCAVAVAQMRFGPKVLCGEKEQNVGR